MDLSTFQLVDAINDMDMLRNLSDQQQQQTHQDHYQQQQNNAYDQLHGDIDLLFQPDHHTLNSSPHMNPYLYNNKNNNTMSSPHCRHTPSQQQHQQNDCFDQEDILTPLISPAMTPSFNYQQQQKLNNSNQQNEVDFSPLSSPAILPQMDRHRPRTSYQDQLNSTHSNNAYKNMSANQICEQYEQLEHAKLLITQKLSELQKSQRHPYDGGYQTSLLSESSCSSSTKDLSKNSTYQQQQVMDPSGDPMAMHHVISRPTSPNQSPPHMEPATPASLMNMKMNTSDTSKLQFSSSGRTQYYSKPSYSTSASTPNSGHVFRSPIMNTTPIEIMSPMMSPTNTTSLSPLALHPRTSKAPRSSSTLKEKPAATARYAKKARRESFDTKSNNIHASPRALKPLLISPTLKPGPKPLPNSSSIPSSRSTVHSVEDAERILATRSNYQNLMEGKGVALGIAFSTQIKSGLEVRRTAHKAAEQKRRDSLKEWFDRLRREVEDGYVKRQKTLMSQVIKAQELEKNNIKKKEAEEEEEEEEEEVTADASAMKPLSKVLLLQYAYEYIASLKDTLQERDKTIEILLNQGGSSHHLKRQVPQDDDEQVDDDDNKEDQDMQESDSEIPNGDL